MPACGILVQDDRLVDGRLGQVYRYDGFACERQRDCRQGRVHV